MEINSSSYDFKFAVVESPVNQISDQIMVDGMRTFRRINFSREADKI